MGNSDAKLLTHKIKQNEYISKALYNNVLKTIPAIIPANFDLNGYNSRILDQKYRIHKNYFDHIFDAVDPNVRLDEEQSKAILAEEDQALILAGAGTGKTTTMTAKVKYLVDIKKVDPAKILVMSYTRKAVGELRERININLGIPAEVTTFHSLGYKYIKSLFPDRQCYVVDKNERREIFLDFIKKHVYVSSSRMADFMECFNTSTIRQDHVYGGFLRKQFSNYETFDDYFAAYKQQKLDETEDIKQVILDYTTREINREQPHTLQGEWVRSKGEAVIANFLFLHGIDYDYEKVYEQILPDNDIYKPDFTLHLGGEEIYVEYFGMSNYYPDRLNTYDKVRALKEKYHKQNRTKFIALDYEQNQGYIDGLAEKLIEFGFKLKPKSDLDIYQTILDRNPMAEIFRLEQFFYKVVDEVKSSVKKESFKQIIEAEIKKISAPDKSLARRQYEYFRQFLRYYSDRLRNDRTKIGLDYSDMIYYSKKFIHRLRSDVFRYDYIIIDEYQDISMERYQLAKATVERSQAKLLAVGDDWQTIYSFSGSKIEYIYNFQKYFPDAKLFKITKTYRNPQTLIDYAGRFVMKNPDQIKKQLRANKDFPSPIVFYGFGGDSKIETKIGEYESMQKAILSIHRQRPDDSILVLARRNRDIDDMFKYPDSPFVDEIDTKVSIRGIPEFKFNAMTIHSAKGLTADWVIVIGLDRGFPTNSRKYFWIYDIFREAPLREKIEFAEERRVFYVALTRTKNYVILLQNRDPEKRSPFLEEIYDMVHED